MKKYWISLCLLVGVSSPAIAGYAPGTIITPNTLTPAKQLLVLEHSLVDLTNGIEILNFNYTLNKSGCDVYKGLTGSVLSNKTACLSPLTTYSTPVVTAHDGWRIGTTQNILNVVKQFPGWYNASSWLTLFPSNRTAMDMIENTLGATRISSGKPSFVVLTSDTILTTGPYSSSPTTLDLINYTSGGDTGYRVSSSGSYSIQYAETSVLLVRDWLGQERAINTVPVPVTSWFLSVVGFLFVCRRQARFSMNVFFKARK